VGQVGGGQGWAAASTTGQARPAHWQARICNRAAVGQHATALSGNIYSGQYFGQFSINVINFLKTHLVSSLPADEGPDLGVQRPREAEPGHLHCTVSTAL
jgi:hypothetical protein